MGRRKVVRWLNDQLVWSLAASGGADDDADALVPWMLLRPGEGAREPFAMPQEQQDAFFHGEGAAPEPRAQKPATLTVKGVLLGCWGRVADARKKRVVLKECARAEAMLGGEACYRPWLLDCETLCQRLLDGRACAPAEDAPPAALCAWEVGAEARGLLAAPVAARSAAGASAVAVAVTGIARLLLVQVGHFYGLKVTEEAGAEASKLLLLSAAPFNTSGPSCSAMRAARSALWEAWVETCADAGLPLLEGVPEGADGPGTPDVPLLFIHGAAIHAN